MSTPHIESLENEIAKIVLMPGDPMRAKYIADNFLENVKCVNKVRGMLAYTGDYKGCKITVFASGMGCPSIGIYAYELYKFYNVEKIIRTKQLNEKISEKANELGIKIRRGEIITSDVFDVYVDFEKYISNYPKDKTFLGCEMESFVLFYLAKKLNREASCLLTVVDSHFDKRSVSSSDRETSLKDMIKLALESAI